MIGYLPKPLTCPNGFVAITTRTNCCVFISVAPDETVDQLAVEMLRNYPLAVRIELSTTKTEACETISVFGTDFPVRVWNKDKRGVWINQENGEPAKFI